MANADNYLFSSLISDIKTYTGKDPLLPWLQGIRKMKESLPLHLLKEKLPRFLQKCVQAFESDKRYRNDLRYIRVWIQLMDFVGDPKLLLRTMEKNGIGTKAAIFYKAYALYYEKLKRFEESEKMYHLGVKNLAEPIGELHKSYEQFLHRMELYKRRMSRKQELRISTASRSIPLHHRETNNIENSGITVDGKEYPVVYTTEGLGGQETSGKYFCGKLTTNDTVLNKPTTFANKDTVIVRFGGSANVGKPREEDACHHGLVDPTINMKEAMNAINCMFREPLEPEVKGRRSQRSQPNANQPAENQFRVFINESLEKGAGRSDQKIETGDLLKHCTPEDAYHFGINTTLKLKSPPSLETETKPQTQKPPQETFKIFVDDDDDIRGAAWNGTDDKECYLEPQVQHPVSDSSLSVLPSTCSDDPNRDSSPQVKLKEDTVVCGFVGSTIFGEPEMENACHHGLVDPTINMKEAMDDINSMFGKPLDFIMTSRKMKGQKLPDQKQNVSNFTIFADETSDGRQVSSCTSRKLAREINHLFEPTAFTKEAMDDINEMFGKPLDL